MDTSRRLFENTFVPVSFDDLPPEKIELFKRAIAAEQSFVDHAKVAEIRWVDKRTLVHINSKNRNRRLYPEASDFVIYAGKSFSNVVAIRLVSLIFPNVDQAINRQNNKVRWINREDYSLGYPIYTATLNPGTYTLTSIVSELDRRLNTPLIKRRKGASSDAHNFIFTSSEDTDLFSLTNINAESAESVRTVANTSSVIFRQVGHGYADGEPIHVSGVRGTVGGIPSTIINGLHNITLLNANEFFIEVPQKSTADAEGGGNTIRTGKSMRWHLLAGEPDSVTNNLGFRAENSSTLIGRVKNSFPAGNGVTQSKIQNLFFGPERNLFFDIEVWATLVQGATTTVSKYYLSGNWVVSEWQLSAYVDPLFPDVGLSFDVSNVGDETGQVLYTSPVVGSFTSLTLHWYGDFEGRRRESSEAATNTATEGESHPFTSIVLDITGCATGDKTELTIPGHGLVVGDYISLIDVMLVPSVYDSTRHRGNVRVEEVVTSNKIKVDFTSTQIQSILGAKAGTRIVTCTFPDHGFNQIVSITQSAPNWVRVTTLETHNIDLLDGVYIAGTNSVPRIDGHYEYNENVSLTRLKILNRDTFEVYFPSALTATGIAGFLVVDQNFMLYGVDAFGGFTELDLNGVAFSVRDVLDRNTFTFSTQTGFSAVVEQGGGIESRIHSKLHGWAGTHDNSPNGDLHKPITLSGNDYSYICLVGAKPGLLNTDKIPDVVGIAQLRTLPGYVTFDEFTEFTAHLDPPLLSLGDFHLLCIDPFGNALNFSTLEWSCCLEVTERLPHEDGSRDRPETRREKQHPHDV
jgi:hypothetical protein